MHTVHPLDSCMPSLICSGKEGWYGYNPNVGSFALSPTLALPPLDVIMLDCSLYSGGGRGGGGRYIHVPLGGSFALAPTLLDAMMPDRPLYPGGAGCGGGRWAIIRCPDNLKFFFAGILQGPLTSPGTIKKIQKRFQGPPARGF